MHGSGVMLLVPGDHIEGQMLQVSHGVHLNEVYGWLPQGIQTTAWQGLLQARLQ